MRYAVDIVGGKVWVVGCFKFIPGSDCVDIQSHMGCKGSRYDYMYSHSINTRAAPKAGFIRGARVHVTTTCTRTAPTPERRPRLDSFGFWATRRELISDYVVSNFVRDKGDYFSPQLFGFKEAA